MKEFKIYRWVSARPIRLVFGDAKRMAVGWELTVFISLVSYSSPVRLTRYHLHWHPRTQTHRPRSQHYSPTTSICPNVVL
jgi:hypothetical protein